MNFVVFLSVFFSSLSLISCSRHRYLLDDSFKFSLEIVGDHCNDNYNSTFTRNLDGLQCHGLSQVSSAQSESDCATACCSNPYCTVWQWCVNSPSSACSPLSSCWVGALSPSSFGDQSVCSSSTGAGWRSMGVKESPAPPTPNAGDLCSVAACQIDTPDATWRTVNLPHDFVVEGKFNETADAGHGYLPYAVGWYRRHFVLDFLHGVNDVIYLDVEGAQTNSQVYLNGVALGSHASGYTPARFYINSSLLLTTPLDNVLAIRVDATQPDGWWYDGGGLYRHVWLTAINAPSSSSSSSPAPAIYLTPDGVYAPAEIYGDIDFSDVNGPTSSNVSMFPRVEISCAADTSGRPIDTQYQFLLTLTVTDASGTVVASVNSMSSIAANTSIVWSPSSTTTSDGSLSLKSPVRLWHVLSPQMKQPARALYTVKVQIIEVNKENGESNNVLDEVSVVTGFRRTEWDAEKGFFLNGIATKIKGMANHQDIAGLGVAVLDKLQWQRVSKLQSMGANGWRTAHNPPTPALLDACDSLGFLVWDENHRNGDDAAMTTLIRRDRNHPSVIIWSVCNEVLCASADSVNDALRLKAIVRTLDARGGRPVSANYNPWVGPSTPLDVQGFDYATSSYDQWHAQAPNIPSISSETSSAVSDREESSSSSVLGHVSGYDVNFPGWGQSACGAWGGIGQPDGQGILTRTFIAGGWVWTGWDYKGEPTPYSWPDINSHFGVVDMCGYEKDRFYWYRAWFADSADDEIALKPYIFPHWNWDDATTTTSTVDASSISVAHVHGTPELDDVFALPSTTAAPLNISVWVYSSAPSIELLLNGVSQGRVSVAPYSHAEFNVVYERGSLEAIAYSDSSSSVIVARSFRNTTKSASALLLTVRDNVGGVPVTELIAGCTDVAMFDAIVVDEDGQQVPTASDNVTFTVTGDGFFIGGGNGDPACHTPDASPLRPAYHGRVLGLVQAARTVTEGNVVVKVEAAGLATAQLVIKVRQANKQDQQELTWCLDQHKLI